MIHKINSVVELNQLMSMLASKGFYTPADSFSNGTEVMAYDENCEDTNYLRIIMQRLTGEYIYISKDILEFIKCRNIDIGMNSECFKDVLVFKLNDELRKFAEPVQKKHSWTVPSGFKAQRV